MKRITLLLMLLFIGFYGNAQTVLTAGDIAFMGGNSDGATNADDNFAFVLLVDIDAATQIIFTDRGWNDVGGFFSDPGDGSFTWTSGVARSAGDIITLNFSALAPATATFSFFGDQLFAIQGSLASPTFIAGLTFNTTAGADDANWDGAATSNSTSARPNALVGNTAVRILSGAGTEYDNFQFSCVLAGVNPVSGTPDAIRTILHDRTNYNGNTSTPFIPVVEAGCTVTVMAAADTTPPVITCAPTPPDITAGINGMAPIPDLVTGSSATDDTSLPANITITQSPTAGTMQGVGVHVVTVTATDEAGNSASCNINVTILEPPSTTLAAGDIAFLGFNLDGTDSFAFVILRDIIAGTNIKFTDCGVNNPNTINCVGGDSSNTWYAPTAMTAGSTVTLQGSTFFSQPLAPLGDQIFAYQGTEASPIFLTGIHSNIEAGTNDTDWDGAATNNDESALPNQLINGVNALRVHNSEVQVDNWQFDCSLVPGGAPLTGTPANIAATINNLAYWVSRDNPEYSPTVNAGCSFSVVISSDTTPPVISDCGPTPPDITADVLGNATVPDLTTGVVATDDMTIPANLTIVQSPAAGTTITAGVTPVTLFVSDEAGNTSTCIINVTVVNIVATTLAAGDIAFVGINHDGNDDFAFILLRPILAGTMITFTDCGVDNPNTISCLGANDFTNTWFSPTDMAAGSIVTLDNTFLPSLGSIGDQIFAYQGPAASPTFIAGIHTSVVAGTNDADWDGSNTSGATSALPDQLTNGVNAIRLYVAGPPETESDNWQFDCTLVPGGLPISGTPAQVAAIINDIQYWVNNDTTPYNPVALATCTYNLDTVPPVAVCQDITVQVDASGSVTIAATDVDGGSTDNVGITSYSVDIDTFDCSDIGTPVTVTLTVADAAGNTDTCTAVVTVEDDIDPTITCPSDITVSNDAGQCSAVVTYSVSSSDNCTGETIVQTAGLASGSTFPVGTTTNTFVVTDASGNTATCSFDVIVNDTENPVVTCPADITVGNDIGNCSAVVNFTPTATDNCPGVTISSSPASGSAFPVGTTVVTVTATDASGNTAMCMFNVTVNDTETPVVTCPADITVNNDPGVCGATVNFTPTATDNCPGTTIVSSPASGSVFPIGTTLVTTTATDASGNTSSCTFNVTVNDTEDPVVTCPADITVSNDPGQCSAVVNFAPTATDNCPGTTIVSSPASGSVFPIGTTLVTTTATDASGNTATCTFNVTVNDTEDPVVTCPADITVSNDPGQCSAVVNFTPTATDNCPGTTIVSSPASGSVFPVGTTTVTVTATDAAGNTATCSFDVTVNDTEDPVVSCPADITVSNDPGQCSAVVNFTPTATDNCPGTTIVSSPASGSVFPVGTTTVTVTATDAAGNTATCSFDVTVNDTEDPVVSCPADITVSNDPGQCSAVVNFTPTATDNCPGTTIVSSPASGSVFPVGTTTVTVTATDAAGNTATCSFDVTVNDTEDPTISCPADITVGNDPGVCGATVTYTTPVGADNCPAANTIQTAGLPSGSVFPVGTTTNTFVVTDASGNTATCSFDVTVNDTEDPTISCPADITVGNDPGVCGATVTYTTPVGADNCPGATTVQTAGLPSGSVFPVGTTTNTFVVTDAAGNTATCSFDVTVNDIEDPVITCPADIIVSNDAGVCGAQVNYSVTATDNCATITPGTVSINPLKDNSLFQEVPGNSNGAGQLMYVGQNGVGANDRGLITFDVAGSVPAGAIITGVNLTMTADHPSAANGAHDFNLHRLLEDWGEGASDNGVAPGSGGGGFGATAIAPDATWDDAMLGTAWVGGAGGTFNPASSAVQTVDANGPYVWSSATLISDVQDMVDNPGANFGWIIIGNETGAATTKRFGTRESSIAPVLEIFYETVSGPTIVQTAGLPSGSTFPVGTTTNTFMVTDAAGNTATCSFDVTVNDTEAPVAICNDITIQLDANGDASITAADIDGGSTDNCGIASLAVSPAVFDCSNVGPNTVTLTVTDVNGNVSTCTSTVTVEDNVAPDAVCMDIDVFLDNNGMASITPADVDGGSTDACGIASLSIDITDFTCADLGPNDVTLTVTDVNGNSSTCIAVVTVIDDIPPVISCPADIVTGTDPGLCSAQVVFTDALAIDNCTVISVVQTAGLPSGSDFPVGDSIIEFTATDQSGNTTTCSFTITVNDDEPAMAVCQDITIQLDANGDATITAADVDGGSTDNCGIASMDVSPNTFDCSNVGDNTVTLTVTDDNGNVSTCTAIVTVEDVTAPDVVCMDIIVDLDPSGTVTILPTDVDGGSTDACGIDTYELDIDTFDCSNVGDNTVTLTVTDVNGNSASCTAIVTVQDVTDPVLTCMDITVELDENGEATIVPEDVIDTLDDACGIFTTAVDIFEFSCDDIGTPVVVQVFAQDNNGNLATCTATVTVIDALAPVLTCPADQTVDPGPGNLFYEIPDYFATGEATAVDNCTDPVTNTTQDPAPGTLVPDGVYTITLTATDDSGNTATCEFELTVESVLGIDDLPVDLSTVVIYPNPATDVVFISNPQNIALEKVTLFDIIGRKVATYDIRGMGTETSLDISNLATASYTVVIEGEGGYLNKRLIKE